MSLPSGIVDRILSPRDQDINSSKWNRLYFYPGRGLQPAEANEIQTILLNVANKLGRTLFREGSIISGIELIQKVNNLVQVTSGTMYIDGQPRDIDGTPINQDLQILGTGREYVGILRTEVILSPENDSSLLDPQIAPTVGAQQFNLKGALRQVYQYTWVLVNEQNPNPLAVPIFEFQDGNLITSQNQGQYTQLLQVLNERTMDMLGHFLVSGFTVSISQSPTDVNKLIIRIDPGKAYVNGAEIKKNAPSIFTIPKAVTTNFVPGEDFIFYRTPSLILLYQLASQPVKDVRVVAAKVKRSSATGNVISVTRSISNPFDDLFSSTAVTPNIGPESSQTGIAIYQILRISNTSGGAADYVQGVDYQLSGNSVLWISGSRPSPSQVYYVDLVLIRALTPGRRVRTIVTDEAVVKGSSGSTDNLTNKDVIRIRSVSTSPGGAGTTYTEGKDFIVSSGRTLTTIGVGALEWTVSGGTQPVTSTTYYVSYEYWTHPVGFEGDFVSVDDYVDTDGVTPAGDYVASYKYNTADLNLENSIDFRVNGGDTPVDGTDVNVQYDFYVPRRDEISLDSSGEFVIHQGVPDINPQFPPVSIATLEIASLDLPANSSNVLINYPQTRRFTVTDLWQLRELLDVQVYNAAVRYLESLAMYEYTSSNKKMILVDPFIDFSRANFLYVGSVPFKCSIDPENGILKLPQLYGSRSLQPLSMTGIAPDPSNSNTSKFKSVAMSAYTEADLIVQPFATQATVLNPFSTLGPIVDINLTPEQAFWPDVSQTPDVRLEAREDSLIPVTQDDLRIDSTRLTRVFGFVRKAFNRFWVGATKIVPWGGTGQLNQLTTIFTPSAPIQNHASDEIVESQAMERINDRIIDRSVTPIMDQQSVVISSQTWLPLADNIEVFFDGVRMTCFPTSSQWGGTQSGTLKADANGVFSGSFIIPAKSRAGRKEVRAVSLVPGSITETVQATSIFAAEGLRQVFNNSYVTIDVSGTSLSSDINVVNPVTRAEPLAQVINAKQNAPIVGVILYFQARPTPGSAGDRPVFVQIRDLDENGQPTTNILAQRVLRAADITPSLDSSQQTIVDFDDPVFIEAGQQYAVVLTTDSSSYAVFQSRLGNPDLLTQSIVVQNPDLGALWRSDGGQGYTQDLYASLKLNVRYAAFSAATTATIVFRNITDLSSGQVLRDSAGNVNIPATPGNSGLLPNRYSKFLHVVSSYTPPGARIIWSYSVDAGVHWTAYTPGVEVDLGGVRTQIQIKCDLDMQQVSGVVGGGAIIPASAAVNLKHNGLVLIAQELRGYYVTYSTNVSPSNNLRVVFVTDQPAANNVSTQSGVKVWYSVDGAVTWNSLDVALPPTERVLLAPLLERRYDGVLATFSKIAIRIDHYNDPTYSSDPLVSGLRVIAY